MGIDFTLEERFWGDFTMDNLNSRQLCFVQGQFAYDSASSTALTVTAARVGLREVLGFACCAKSDTFFTFDPATDTIRPISGVYTSVTGFSAFYATASTVVASITSIPFLCWGFR